MLVSGAKAYIKTAFDSEDEIERVVLENAEVLFGPGSLFLPKSKISTLGGKATIPDGIVVDLEQNQWYLVEAERASHGTWTHISPQITAQLTALSRDESKEDIIRTALEMVKNSDVDKETLRELSIEEIELHGRIAQILKKPPVVAIPIDDIAPDLREWANNLKNSVKIWILEKYVEQGGGRIIYSLPDEAAPALDTSRETTVVPERLKGSAAISRLITSGLLHAGEELWMDYGRKGHPKRRFTAIVREDGLEVDGRVYSPSYAVVACMQKAGSPRKTANGWLHWRKADGTLINDLEQRSQEDSGLA